MTKSLKQFLIGLSGFMLILCLSCKVNTVFLITTLILLLTAGCPGVTGKPRLKLLVVTLVIALGTLATR